MLKSEISYLDENNNIVDREKATHSIIRQTDEEGNLVMEEFSVDETVPLVDLEDYDDFTEYEKEFIDGFVDADSNNFNNKTNRL